MIPNAVDIDELRPRRHARRGAEGASWAWTAPPCVGFIGSLLRLRGAGPAARRAAATAAARAPTLRVLLVGGGPQEQALKAQAQRAGHRRQGRLHRPRAARRGAALLRPGRRAGLPAPQRCG
ncbi:MAG: hypothetical protein MZW92_21325 [Comamonadaceae bacterium]|nr:hypothetical protein [Comamonadaceae bacterium]